jgi:signal transduction histidine kinase
LNNIAKYSRATRVTIAIGEAQQVLRMTITDNGVGFDEKTIVPGNGLRNLRQRAATLGGNVTVRSALGEGTVVEFHVRIP